MERAWWDMTAGFSSGVPFAVDAAGNWRDVDAVDRGKECACFCAECKAPLIARKGEIRVHHFAHSDRRECQNALQASLYGMAVKILGESEPEVQIPPPYSVSEISRRVGQSERDTREAIIGTGLDDRLRGAKVVLLHQVVHSSRVEDSRPEVPEVESKPANLALHFLSAKKRLPAIEGAAQSTDVSRVLAVNLVAFAWQWRRVCDQRNVRDKNDLPPSAIDEFRDWIANSTEGRGWVAHKDRAEAERKVRAYTEKSPPVAPKPVPISTSFFVPAYGHTAPPRWSPPKRTLPPEQPDTVLSQGAGVCQRCSSPLDEVRLGSGLFNGKRVLLCRSDRKHPMVHLGS
jgi:hypothetical protein